MSAGSSAAATWPADVIHVNEDGWVLINRGSRHGISVGLGLLVVGQGVRELRDLFAGEGSEGGDSGQQALPVVLRTRRTYELLEVVHVEDASSIAIAKRTPAERRPQFYLGPEGETLVWVPLPPDFRQPQNNQDIEGPTGALPPNTADEPDGEQAADEPPEQEEQEDELWEQALPLNSVNVGDLVVLAVPVSSPAPGVSLENTPAPSSSAVEPTSYEQGRTYDWMKPAE